MTAFLRATSPLCPAVSEKLASRDTTVGFMSQFFTRERFGSPQVIAGFILLLFLVQCVWFAAKVPLADHEIAYVLQGQRQLKLSEALFHQQASPATALAASLPLLTGSLPSDQVPPAWRWLGRAPFILAGMLLGASIWYVARRLYGNTAGYIALALYSFSPLAVTQASTIGPDVLAAWGAFGAVFTAIGVAHTLYAPREVVLWNWRRILLLGVALGVGMAAHLAVVLLIPISLAFMWYLVPERRGAATVIMLAASAIGSVLLFAFYGFSWHALSAGVHSSRLADFHPEMYSNALTYSFLGQPFLHQPTILVLLVASIVTYFAWSRTRFFGTTAPLLVFAILLLIGLGMPHQGGLLFFVALALTFAYVFIGGVLTDLLESRVTAPAFGVVLGVLTAHGLLSIAGLIRL